MSCCDIQESWFDCPPVARLTTFSLLWTELWSAFWSLDFACLLWIPAVYFMPDVVLLLLFILIFGSFIFWGLIMLCIIKKRDTNGGTLDAGDVHVKEWRYCRLFKSILLNLAGDLIESWCNIYIYCWNQLFLWQQKGLFLMHVHWHSNPALGVTENKTD